MGTGPDEDHGSRAKTAVKEEERRLRVGDGAALRGFVAEPATGFRRGAVLIIHDIWGYTDFYKDLARRITAQGHAAALVGFFGRQGDLPEGMAPLQLAGEIRIPILAIFGGADPGIPADQIARFHDALQTDKEFVTYPDAPHGFLRYGATTHRQAIDDALRRTYGFFMRVLATSG